MSDAGARAFVALRSVAIATAFVSLWVWLASLARQLDARFDLELPPYLRPPGYLLATAGAALAASCVLAFIVRGRGTPAPFDPPRVFVATGPYRYVRNPMYAGAIAALLGAGLSIGSPSIAILGLCAWLSAHVFVVVYEERDLERRFGEEYRQYKSHVNRWWPRKPRRRSA